MNKETKSLNIYFLLLFFLALKISIYRYVKYVSLKTCYFISLVIYATVRFSRFNRFFSNLNNYKNKIKYNKNLSIYKKFISDNKLRDYTMYIFSMFSTLLGSGYKNYIHKFAAESFAFLMRKVTN